MSIESPQSKVLDNSRKYDGKILHVSNENAELSLNDRNVVVASNTSAVTITLPNVGEAAGKIFSVRAPNGVTNAVTVTDGKGGSIGWSDISLATDGAAAVVYSDGMAWHQLN